MAYFKNYKGMTNNSYPNIKSLIISVLSNNDVFNTLKECRKTFIISVFIVFSSIKGKINFLQLQRFSEKCEQYFRINFENKFNFQGLNLDMIKERVSECVIAFDLSFECHPNSHVKRLSSAAILLSTDQGKFPVFQRTYQLHGC